MCRGEQLKLAKSRAKAKRAYRLHLRGHSLQDIAVMCNIPTGSVTKRVQYGARLVDAGL